MKPAKRIEKLPPYLFAEIDKKVAEAEKNGVDVIRLGIGDPDMSTPEFIIDRMISEVKRPENHKYPSYVGLDEYREAVSKYYDKRFGVDIDKDKEVVSLIGSKEGIAHISQCFVDPGDINLVPDPGYPVYGIGTMFAGGESYKMPLKKENDFLPDLSKIPEDVAKKAKIMFLNYPNNPTAAIATEEFFKDVVEFCKKYNILVCHDSAYTEIGFDGYKAPSFLETEGAKDIGIEFGSLSKAFNMTGWRIGYAVGNEFALEALGRFKTNVDSGVFQAVQLAAVEGLLNGEDSVNELNKIYEKRRDKIVETLKKVGINVEAPKASFYVWAPVPEGYTASEFTTRVLEETGVVVTPGVGFGEYGEGFFRISLTVDENRLEEAMERIGSQLSL
ncbi:LL-diaminopimelate aminotransferase [Natranaerofaba carboxydovora]|uniref:LL-diaminopimelate aminotransferase n=1 Tax=Natranaerofaba carboxydovora TaxID=2742683 RepID=UPI001F1313FE|nr:LL-diaminopimelate aminotransferase [Natranaerofaba carboxydovora]UMZ73219.1 LL-diaminopimelate aminotransferase [Natranaerofaba carboxydovora]